MSSGRLITMFAALALMLSVPSLVAASVSGRPSFARAYVGTVTGSLRTSERVDTWTVKSLAFRLQNARLARGRWGGTYLVTGGRVTFTTTAMGACTSKKSGSFSLGRLSWDAAAVSFLQNLREPGYAYQARVSKEHPVTVTQRCAGAPTAQEIVSPAGGLWLMTDIGERLVPGKRIAGRHTDSSERGSRTWAWNLASAG
jgi:hypothetical protein